MAVNQAYLFLIFSLCGISIGLLFDFFRILRKSFKTVNLITYIEDALFWVLTGINIIFLCINFQGGTLRLFMCLGLISGLSIYMLLFSNRVIKTFVFFITTIKNIINKIIKSIIEPMKIIYNFLDKNIFRKIYI